MEPRRKYVPRPKVEKVVLLPPTIPVWIATNKGKGILVQDLTEDQLEEVAKKWEKKLRKEHLERKNDKSSKHQKGGL